MIAVAAAVGSALVGGIYAAFAVMVMPALRANPDPVATEVMTRINRAAERGPFILVFGATALAATALGVGALRTPSVAVASLAASALSLVSTGITVVANVPLNRRLDRERTAFWPRYHRRWSAWNAARAVAAIGAVAVLSATAG